MMDELISEQTDDSSLVLEETAWFDLTARAFFAGYSETDSIYDEI